MTEEEHHGMLRSMFFELALGNKASLLVILHSKESEGKIAFVRLLCA